MADISRGNEKQKQPDSEQNIFTNTAQLVADTYDDCLSICAKLADHKTRVFAIECWIIVPNEGDIQYVVEREIYQKSIRL